MSITYENTTYVSDSWGRCNGVGGMVLIEVICYLVEMWLSE